MPAKNLPQTNSEEKPKHKPMFSWLPFDEMMKAADGAIDLVNWRLEEAYAVAYLMRKYVESEEQDYSAPDKKALIMAMQMIETRIDEGHDSANDLYNNYTWRVRRTSGRKGVRH